MLRSDKIYESGMASGVKTFFSNQGYIAFDEIPSGQKRIDLLFVYANFPKMVAVELKVRDWRRAFRQALHDKFCAHRVYVAIWHEFFKRVDQELFRRYGIGILEVGRDDIEERIAPKKCASKLTVSMRSILTYLEEERNQRFVWG